MAPGQKNHHAEPRKRKKQFELDIGAYSSSDEEKEENIVVPKQQQHQPAIAAAAKKKKPAAARARTRPLATTAAAAENSSYSSTPSSDNDEVNKKTAATKPKTSKQPPAAAASDASSDDCSSLFNKSPFDPPRKKTATAAALEKKSNETTVKTPKNIPRPLATDADNDTPFHDTRSDAFSNGKVRAANRSNSDDDKDYDFFDSRQKACPEENTTTTTTNNNNSYSSSNSSKPPAAKETTKPAATSKPPMAKKSMTPTANPKRNARATAVTSTATATSSDKELEAEFQRTLQQIGKKKVASTSTDDVVGAPAAATKVNTLEPRRRRHRRNAINEESKLEGRSKKRCTDNNNGKPMRSSLPPKPAANVASRPLTTTKVASSSKAAAPKATSTGAHATKRQHQQQERQQVASPSSVHTRTSTISSVSSQTGGATSSSSRRSPYQTTAAVASSLPDTVKVANKRMKTSSHHHQQHKTTSRQPMASPPPREPTFPRSSPRLKQNVAVAAAAASNAVQKSTITTTTTAAGVAVEAAAAVIVPENDPSYNEDPTVALLLKQCWVCAVPLQVGTNNDTDEQQICWNVRHSHPSLQVPVCSVCAEDIAAETLQENMKENSDNGDYCAGCLASEEDIDVLLLCDSVSDGGTTKCDRAFCLECVSKAQGRRAARRAIDDDASWHCPVCQPTNRILRLQQEDPATKRPVEVVLAELETVESEKTRCEQELDRDPAEKAKEFRIDLLLDGVTGEELEEQVVEALQVWQENWQRHHVRLSDRIARLLDELDVDHTLTAAECYNFIKTGKFEREGGTSKADDDDTEDDDDDDADAVEEPAWVRSANKVVGKRIRKREKNKSVWDPLSIEMYRKECYEDVEELDVSGLGKEDFENRSVRSGWEPRARPDEAMIQLAQECEARELKRRKVEIQFVVAETEDKEEEKKMVARKRDFHRSSGDHEKRSSRRARTASDHGAVVRNVSERPSTSGIKSYASPAETISASTGASRAFVGSATKKPSPKKNLFPSPNGSTNGFCNGSSNPQMSEALVLCHSSSKNKQGEKAIRTVDVSRKLSQQLKSHQAEGIKFMFENCFSDFAYVKDGDSDRIGGCILAHNMGLGKTFATIALLHTLMTHASMKSITGDPLVKKVLLIVPVNTIANWENEFRYWLDGERRQIVVININDVVSQSRDTLVQRWSELGGVLLISDRSFQRLKNNNSLLADPDVVCMDEAHLLLKNSSSLTYQKLMLVKTRRRIALTGSPFQNNLLEYFRLINYVRPGVFGYDDENNFKLEFADPITSGLPSDATDDEILNSLRKSKELNERLTPYVHRKDASELKKTLPPLFQVVLHIRPTKMQTKLYRRYERQKKRSDDNNRNNFFKQYKALGPVNNHPGSLLCPNKGGKADKDETEDDTTWWERIREKEGEDEMKGVMNGYKMVLLLHTLAYCHKVNDKVLIFAVDLSTHNYIEQVLALEDWTKHVPSLAERFPGMQLGGWQKGEDFVRIDGSTSGAERGKIVDDFKRDSIKAFLISQAGGIGINLCEANRVVLVDNHFNPTVATQALFRAYRFGQTKPVFCYRLLTQGTVEEKVYKRCVTKTGVSLRIIDKESIKSNFSSRELQDLMSNHLWVQCDRCEKWRILIGENPDEDMPEKWYCEMNTTDTCNNKCEHSEKTQAWYERYIANGMNDIAPQALSPVKKARDAVRSATLPQQNHDDALLENLIQLSDLGSKKPLVSQYYFHDALLETVDNSKELERVEREISKRAEETKQPPADDAVGESNDGKVAAAPAAASAAQKPSSLPSEKKQPSVFLASQQALPKKTATGAPARARKDGSPMPKKSRSPPRRAALDGLSSLTSAKLPKEEPALIDLLNDKGQRHFPEENQPQNSRKQTAAKPIAHATGKADDAIDLCFSDDE